MNIEDQVCSLEYAKILKKLGVEQKSLFYYCNGCAEEYQITVEETLELPQCPAHGDNYSAFTVAELGEMLGNQIASGKGGKQYNEEYVCFSIVHTKEFKPRYKSYQTTAKTEANARAEMLIYLIASKFIEINKKVKNESARQ